MSYTTHNSGDENTTDYRLYYERDGKACSPFHDVPLVVDSEKRVYNMVVEIPRGTNGKFEIDPKAPYNPIKQDVKNGKLRFVNDGVVNQWGYPWNYGCAVQTYEDPEFKHPDTGCMGDGDPLDLCEIGQAVAKRGEIKQVKVICSLALIDDGESDFKIICIDVNDPLADKINGLDDLNHIMPGFVEMTYEWFRTYKIPTGKPPNKFAWDDEAKDRAYSEELMAENHEFWRKFIMGEAKSSLALANVSVEGSPFKTDAEAEHKPYAEHVVSTVVRGEPDNTVNSVATFVAVQQRTKFFGAESLPAVLQAVYEAAQAVKAGNDAASVLSKAPIRAFVTEGATTIVDADALYSVAFNKDATLFGVYRPATKTRGVPGGLSGDIATAGFDQAAHAYANYDAGVWGFTVGYDVHSFKLAEFADAETNTGDLADSGELLEALAPAAFIKSRL